MKEQMIEYLQNRLDQFNNERKKYGDADRIVAKQLTEMLACKEMAEALIGAPINLGIDGRVTVGY